MAESITDLYRVLFPVAFDTLTTPTPWKNFILGIHVTNSPHGPSTHLGIQNILSDLLSPCLLVCNIFSELEASILSRLILNEIQPATCGINH